MSYIEIHIATNATHADNLSNQLTLLGALAVTMKDAGDQPIYEPSAETPLVWDETTVVGLFDGNHQMLPLVSHFENQQVAGLLSHFRLIPVADEDWVRRSLDSFKPIPFGKRLWICPSWHTPPSPNAVNVMLDPGLAFGTGSHPTTALCLEWLDEHITSDPTMIDYGCGSGILGIAALKLGAKQVLAVDHDAQALQATNANALQNGIQPIDLKTVYPDEVDTLPADIVVANILAKPLIELSSILAKLTKIGGKIALSGILKEQVADITAAYEPYFTLQMVKYSAEWCLVSGVKTK